MNNNITMIIPVYNTPILDLNRCFFSLFNQTNKNFNLIIVDDGSEKLISDYLYNIKYDDISIKILHKSNTGLTDSENFALQYVETEYLCICDSDDAYDLNFIDNCYKYINSYNPDLICGNINYIPIWPSQKKY